MKQLGITAKREKIFLTFVICFLIICIYTMMNFTKSVDLVNSSQVNANKELTYYLDVSYDGIDKSHAISGDTKVLGVKSDTIYVEDRIPEGLIFDGFVETKASSITAVTRDGSNNACQGYVVNDSNGESTKNNYYGLHYDDETKTVTFKVKELQAGCKITVGIRTKTPPFGNQNRFDFYNTATAKEGYQTATSNTVHVYMEKEEVPMYKVTYKYADGAPSNAPKLPNIETHTPGATISVPTPPKLEGYSFEWTSIVELVNGIFVMPSSDVTIIGVFTELPKYEVSYEIEGEKPDSYTPPENKLYYENSNVRIDSLKVGEKIGEYTFLGWTMDGELIKSNEIIMPNRNVSIVGKFEKNKYRVTYKFIEKDLPDNYSNLIPKEQEYLPGSLVELPKIENQDNYQFLGWDREDNFEMPESDITIYGEWKLKTGVFSPIISKEIVDRKYNYKSGDIVNMKVKIINNQTYTIKNVQVKENSARALYQPGENYTIRSEHIAEIPEMKSGQTIILNVAYIVSDEDIGIVKSESEILSAISINENYELDLTIKHKAEVSFKVLAKLEICKISDKDSSNQVYQFHMSSTDKEFETWIELSSNECEIMYVDAKEYQITEILPQSYELNSITYSSNLSGTREKNTTTFTIGNDANYEITFTNKYLKKGYYHSFGRIVNKIINQVIVPKYTVTYSDGVEGTAFENQVFVVDYGASFPQYDGDPMRTGYSFAGWSIDIPEFVEGDVLLVAQWEVFPLVPDIPQIE